MQNKKINGKFVSEILYEELNKYLKQKGKMPSVVDISIGDDFGGLMYSKMKKKKIEKETGINFESIHFEDITYRELKDYLTKLSSDAEITGIMLQLPLPKGLREHEREILDTIACNKDIDGLTTISAGLLSLGEDALIPCTALGIETLLKVYDVLLEGKKVAIINRSNIVGKPLANLLLKDNAMPIVCHSKTSDLRSITNECDIVVAALNKQEYIDASYIKDKAVVIDVGVHKNELGRTVGDVKFDEVSKKASLITPPTGSVGPMTICMLAYNSVKSLYGSEVNEVLQTGINKAKVLVKERKLK